MCKFNILLIEDNPDHRELTKKALEESEEDYEVDSFSSGKECLVKISKKDYSCILLDYRMPDMNGLEVVDKLNEIGADIPVIMITGLGDENIAVEAMKKGVFDYIVKDNLITDIPLVIKRACEYKLRKEQEKTAEKSGKTVDILQVEDDTSIQRMTEVFFKNVSDNYRVEAVSTGEKGLEKLSSGHYDIVLLDYMLPGMTGLEVLKDIREKGIDVPVIMITAAGDEKVAMEAINLGADGYVAKVGNYMPTLPSRVNGLVEKYSLKRELAQARDYTDNIICSMIDILIVTDPEGRIKTVNQAALDMLGYSEEEIMGKPADMLLNGGEHGELLTEDSIRNIEVTYKTKAGRKIPVLFSGSAMKDKDGNIIGNVGVVRDMSEMKELQARLMQSSKMAAIGKFAAGVAHEIRNPLTTVSMNVAFMQEDLKDNEKAIRRLNRIEKEVDRATNIVKSLLATSRTKKEEMVISGINHLIEDAIVLREHQVSLSNVEIVRELDPELPEVKINPGEMSQVFLNLINNAVDAMPGGGKLLVRTYTGKVEKGRRKSDKLKFGEDIICAEFEDTGEGIPGDILDNIFTPLFTTKEQGKGTGLGLYISMGIVEKHGGDIEIKSKVGEGSTFIIKLPLEEKNV